MRKITFEIARSRSFSLTRRCTRVVPVSLDLFHNMWLSKTCKSVNKPTEVRRSLRSSSSVASMPSHCLRWNLAWVGSVVNGNDWVQRDWTRFHDFPTRRKIWTCKPQLLENIPSWTNTSNIWLPMSSVIVRSYVAQDMSILQTANRCFRSTIAYSVELSKYTIPSQSSELCEH